MYYGLYVEWNAKLQLKKDFLATKQKRVTKLDKTIRCPFIVCSCLISTFHTNKFRARQELPIFVNIVKNNNTTFKQYGNKDIERG